MGSTMFNTSGRAGRCSMGLNSAVDASTLEFNDSFVTKELERLPYIPSQPILAQHLLNLGFDMVPVGQADSEFNYGLIHFYGIGVNN